MGNVHLCFESQLVCVCGGVSQKCRVHTQPAGGRRETSGPENGSKFPGETAGAVKGLSAENVSVWIPRALVIKDNHGGA